MLVLHMIVFPCVLLVNTGKRTEWSPIRSVII